MKDNFQIVLMPLVVIETQNRRLLFLPRTLPSGHSGTLFFPNLCCWVTAIARVSATPPAPLPPRPDRHPQQMLTL